MILQFISANLQADEPRYLTVYRRPDGTEYVNLSLKRTSSGGATRRFPVVRDAYGAPCVVIRPERNT